MQFLEDLQVQTACFSGHQTEKNREDIAVNGHKNCEELMVQSIGTVTNVPPTNVLSAVFIKSICAAVAVNSTLPL